jgi:hypothetical protein
MRLRLLILAAAATGLLLAAVEVPALAARAGLSLNPAVGAPTSLRAKGSGFAAGELVALFFAEGWLRSAEMSWRRLPAAFRFLCRFPSRRPHSCAGWERPNRSPTLRGPDLICPVYLKGGA